MHTIIYCTVQNTHTHLCLYEYIRVYLYMDVSGGHNSIQADTYTIEKHNIQYNTTLNKDSGVDDRETKQRKHRKEQTKNKVNRTNIARSFVLPSRQLHTFICVRIKRDITVFNGAPYPEFLSAFCWQKWRQRSVVDVKRTQMDTSDRMYSGCM